MATYDLGFLGCGNMAKAIVRGLKRAKPELRLAASDPDRAAVEAAGIAYVSSNAELAKESDALLFAVKPFHAFAVLAEIAPFVTEKTRVISIMAGFPTAKLREALPRVSKFSRVMPNLAAKQLEAMSALTFSEEMTPLDRTFVRDVFDAVGRTVTAEERDLDAVTAVSGSGTAYVYEFLKHLIAGGVDCGLDEATARVLAVQTLRGAAAMVDAASGAPIDPMIDAVCSKGGTTIEAIKTLRSEGFGEIVEHAVRACYDRSVEMGRES